MPRPIITLLTDFGLVDSYVAAMKGVILTIAPEADLVDISHEVERYAIGHASFSLAQVWKLFPKGTVHLVVVDPGVGSTRRPILAAMNGQFFVAPDNGVLTMSVLSAHGKPIVREITAERFFRQPVSATFHGRDIFAPVAAHLASGVDDSEFGPVITDYVMTDSPEPVQDGVDAWIGTALRSDRFGNIVTNFDKRSFSWVADGGFEMRVGEQVVSKIRTHYSAGEAGQIFVIFGSANSLEISCNQRDAAAILNVFNGASIRLKRVR